MGEVDSFPEELVWSLALGLKELDWSLVQGLKELDWSLAQVLKELDWSLAKSHTSSMDWSCWPQRAMLS